MPTISSKDSFIRSKLEQILSTSLRNERESKMGEREEWERFGHSNFTLRIDVKRGGGRLCFILGSQE